MPYRLARTPWALAARGVAAAAFGVLTLAWPTMTVATFLTLFAVYALVDGLLTLLTAARFRSRTGDARGPRDPLVLLGALGVASGLAAALWSDATMQALLILVALWAAATGAAQLYVAYRGRTRLTGAWLLGGAGVAGIGLAVLIFVSLAAGEVRVGWEVAAYGLAAGGLLVTLGWRVAAEARRTARSGRGAHVAGPPHEAAVP